MLSHRKKDSENKIETNISVLQEAMIESTNSNDQ